MTGEIVDRKTFNLMRKCENLSETDRLQIIHASTLHPYLRSTLAAFVTVARREESETINELWPSITAVSAEAGMSHSAARNRIEKLRDAGVLVKIRPENTHVPGFGFRHQPTYLLNLRVLVQRNIVLGFPPGATSTEQAI